ncbi:MAG: hypothetical protein IH614_18670 [Desulfuromonadales bacterium]|nr:hypothetical protein [Desulfuromonadales bacterium]
MVQKDRWAISFFAGDSPLQLVPLAGVEHPVLSAAMVTDVPAEFIADPFLLRHEEQWYLFFEVLNRRSGRGEIGLATSSDGRSWQYGGIVLAEAIHLSYPFVFAWQGEIYMVPESIAAREVRLYRASDFPRRWEPVGRLLTGDRLSDPTLLHRDGRWWLFARGAKHSLVLYHAESLTGPWQEHPRSPLLREDLSRTRPAGRVIEANGRLLRFAQDGLPWYGHRVLAFEITELTPHSYREQPIEEPVLAASGLGWNRDGMHHLDAHLLGDGSWLAAVDGFSKYWTFSPSW